MNPLSSHPPRTPRPSNVSSSVHHVYGGQIYEDKTETGSVADDTELAEEDAEATRLSATVIRKERVLQDMLLTSNGRDKVFKLIQYSIRLYLLFHIPLTRSRLLKNKPRVAWEAELVKRLNSTASGMSFTRKFLLLFNWLSPLNTITAQQTTHLSSAKSTSNASKTFLQTLLYTPPPVLLELVQAIADDVSTLSLMGMLGKRTGDRAGRFADWCWFFATLVGLVENGVERQVMGYREREVESRLYIESMAGATAKSAGKLSKHDEKELSILHRQSYWLEVTRAKLAMDLIFVSYDLFKIKRGSKSVKTFAGLTSAILSFSKLYDRHRTTLAKVKVA